MLNVFYCECCCVYRSLDHRRLVALQLASFITGRDIAVPCIVRCDYTAFSWKVARHTLEDHWIVVRFRGADQHFDACFDFKDAENLSWWQRAYLLWGLAKND
tara:strand:+ start:229 stop:534 length:306 start_codon:yes stop_codon:yes gene_type:complete